jgi:hypothetical protein
MSYMVNPYILGGVIELERNTSWYQSTISTLNVTTDARPIGAASATRRVFALITVNFGIISGPATLNSVTIGGISATIHVAVNEGDDVLNAIASAVVPAGSTAVVTANFSHAADDIRVGCIALDHPLGIAVHDTLGVQDVEPLSGTIDYPSAGGYGMFLARRASVVNAIPSINWTGAEGYYLEYFETEDDGDIFRDPTAAAYVLKQSGNGVSIQAAWGSNVDNILVGVTAGPA